MYIHISLYSFFEHDYFITDYGFKYSTVNHVGSCSLFRFNSKAGFITTELEDGFVMRVNIIIMYLYILELLR